MHSVHLGFLHWIKDSVGLHDQRLFTKSFAGCFVLPLEGSRHHFSVDKLSEFQISLVGEPSSPITLIFDEMCGELHSAETSVTDSGHESRKRDWIRLSSKKLFSRRDSIQHTCNAYI